MLKGSGSLLACKALTVLALLGLTSGCASMIKDKIIENNDEVWKERKLDRIDEGMTPELAKKTRAFAEKTFDMFPDFKVEWGEIALDGDYVFVRWTATGTHKKWGKKITVRGITYAKIDGKKVVDQQVVWNEFDSAKQMGYKLLNPNGETEEIELFY